MTVDSRGLAADLEVLLRQEFPEDQYFLSVPVASDETEVVVLVKNYDTKRHHRRAFEVEGLDFDAIVSELILSEFEQAVWSASGSS